MRAPCLAAHLRRGGVARVAALTPAAVGDACEGSACDAVTDLEALTDKTPDADFQQALAEGAPVVLDFTSSWCHNCRLMGEVLDYVAERSSVQGVRFVRLDLDRNMKLAAHLGVRKVPTVLLFSDGSPKPVKKFVGLRKSETIHRAIEENFGQGQDQPGPHAENAPSHGQGG